MFLNLASLERLNIVPVQEIRRDIDARYSSNMAAGASTTRH
jgi:hypothetical protein